MQLELYAYYGEKNLFPKPKFNPDMMDAIATIDGTLKGETSVIDPVIDVQFNSDYLRANYAHIPEFCRAYFITNITIISNTIMRISMHVDVLESFDESILSLNALIIRNKYNFDVGIDDPLISWQYGKDVIDYVPTKGALVNTTFKTNDVSGTIKFNVVITTARSSENIPSQLLMPNIPSPVASLLPSVNILNNGGGAFDFSVCTDSLRLSKLNDAIINDTTLPTYIKSILLFPFVPSYKINSEANPAWETLKAGSKSYDVEVIPLSYQLSEYHIIADFRIPMDDDIAIFNNYEPYKTYEIYLPYVGWVSLNACDILSNRIIVVYNINYSDGSSFVNIVDITNNKIIYGTTAQVGISLGFTSTNNEEIANARRADTVNMIGSTLVAGLGAVAMPAAAPIVLAGALANTANWVSKQSQYYEKATTQITGGLIGSFNSQEVHVKITSSPMIEDNELFNLRGRPLNRSYILNTQKGYTEIGAIHLNDIYTQGEKYAIPATTAELDEIETLLKQGVILYEE